MNPGLILTVIAVIFLGTSCQQRTCNNKNSVFDQHSPGSKEYTNELARALRNHDPKTLSFTLDKYQQSGEKEFLWVDIQGEGFCAKGIVEVKEWGKLAGIQKTKGIGYSGAALKNLQLDMYQGLSGTNFQYKDVEAVID